MALIIILIIVICLESSLDTSRGYFTWPQTYPGEVSEIVCERGKTRRACSVSGFWQTPFITNCYVSTEELFRYIEKVAILILHVHYCSRILCYYVLCFNSMVSVSII